jgi:16S rRNA (cytosine1402-N4)-methyltransferase
MDQNQTLTAKDIVNQYSFDDLVKIFFEFGEEKFARIIAKNIVLKRQENAIITTFDLVDVIKDALPEKVLRKKGHPAKKVFQALRIAVNNELNILEESLRMGIDLLKPKGRMAVITFHSLEDRIVKNLFKKLSVIEIPKGLPIISNEVPKIKLINRKVIIASEEELDDNNRAHSAKLRVIEKN